MRSRIATAEPSCLWQAFDLLHRRRSPLANAASITFPLLAPAQPPLPGLELHVQALVVH